MRRLVLVSIILAVRAHASEVFRLDIDNVVHPVTVEMVADAVDQARTQRLRRAPGSSKYPWRPSVGQP